MRIISIIVTHNRLKELKNCLQYIDKQIKKPDKILVVNNNSSDGTEDFLILNNIDHINSSKNIGSAGGWNIGVEYALNNSKRFNFNSLLYIGLIPALIPLVLISLPSLLRFNICSESNLINSNFFSCNFNFSATS
mgnify:CR=1 FL=1